MTRWMLISAVLFLTACSEEANLYKDEEGGDRSLACPAVYVVPTINFQVQSLDPLPPNLMIAAGGDVPDVDECSAEKNAPITGAILLNTYRTNGNIYVPFWIGSADANTYFPNPDGAPAWSTIDLKIYTRPTCGDVPSLRYELKDVPIVWKEIFKFGNGCGGSYSGAADVQVQ